MNSDRVYPERKSRELSNNERTAIRALLKAGELDIYEIAQGFQCSASQVAGIKAWIEQTKGGHAAREA